MPAPPTGKRGSTSSGGPVLKRKSTIGGGDASPGTPKGGSAAKAPPSITPADRSPARTPPRAVSPKPGTGSKSSATTSSSAPVEQQWEVPHMCYLSCHSESPTMSESAISVEDMHNIVSIQARPQPSAAGAEQIPTADFEFNNILDSSSSSAPSAGGGGDLPPGVDPAIGLLSGSPSINQLCHDVAQDLVKGFNASVVSFCQPPSAVEGANSHLTRATPSVEMLYGSSSGILSTVTKFLFDALEKGQGPDTNVKETIGSGGGRQLSPRSSGGASSSASGTGKWNYSVEVSFLEFFQEDFSDLLLLPPSEKFTTILKKTAALRKTASMKTPGTGGSKLGGAGGSSANLKRSQTMGSPRTSTRDLKSPSTSPNMKNNNSSTLTPAKGGTQQVSRQGSSASSIDGEKKSSGASVQKEAPPKKEETMASEGVMIQLTDDDGGDSIQQVQTMVVDEAALPQEGEGQDRAPSPNAATATFQEPHITVTPASEADLKSKEDGSNMTPTPEAEEKQQEKRKSTIATKENGAPDLRLRKTDTGHFVDGAQNIMVNSAQDLISVVSGGIAHRHDTKKSKLAHYAHTVMKISIRQTAVGSDQCLHSVLTLADVNTLERVSGGPVGSPTGTGGGPSKAKMAFQRAKKAIASSMAFRRLLQSTHSPSGSGATNDIQLNSICRDSQLTQLISDSFVGNVKTRLVSALEIPPKPEADPLCSEDLAETSGNAILTASLNSLRLLGRRPGHTKTTSTIKNTVSPNIIRVQVAAHTIQMEVQKLKRDLKNAESAEPDEQTEREKEAIRLKIATEEGRLSAFNQKMAKKEQSSQALKAIVEKQRAALQRVSSELAKKEEVLGEKENLATQVDNFLNEQKALKDQMAKDRLELSVMNLKLREEQEQIALDQSMHRRRSEHIKEAEKMTKEQFSLRCAAVFTQVLEKARVKDETERVTKEQRLLKGKRGVLLSKENLASRKIEKVDQDVELENVKCSALEDRLDEIVADKSVSTLEKAIKSLEDLIKLTKEQNTEADEELTKVNKELEEVQKDIDVFRASDDYKLATSLEEEFGKLTADRSALSHQVINLESSLEKETEEGEDKEKEILELEELIAGLREKNLTVMDASDLLRSHIDELEAQIEKAELDGNKIVDEIGFLDATISSLDEDLIATSRFHDGLCDVAAEKLLPM